MSSIYKKGRDGYFYYQRYIYNEKTGKINKKIFHSLGTKDIEIAREKQAELDRNYNQIKKDNKIFSFLNFKAVVLFLLMVVIFQLGYLFNNSSPEMSPSIERPSNVDIVSSDKSSISSELIIDTIRNKINIDTLKLIQQKTDNLSESEKKDVQGKSSKNDYSFKIHKIEEVSGVFEQGKIYALVDEDLSSESLLIICEKLVKKYSKYSNIIICLYAQNNLGKKLANGDDSDLSNQDKKKAWLAMYSYNPVEGVYFDDNPTSFMGVN